MFKAKLKAVLKAVFDDIFAVARDYPPPRTMAPARPAEPESKAPPKPKPAATDAKAQVTKVAAKPKKQKTPASTVQAKPTMATPKARAIPADVDAKVQAEIEALRRIAPYRPRSKPRRTAYRDDFDDEDRMAMVSLPETEHVIFSYRDAGGNETDRDVLVERAGDDHFQGYCLMRRGVRTFLYSRIVGKVTRLDTGEILTKAKWRRELVDNN